MNKLSFYVEVFTLLHDDEYDLSRQKVGKFEFDCGEVFFESDFRKNPNYKIKINYIKPCFIGSAWTFSKDTTTYITIDDPCVRLV